MAIHIHLHQTRDAFEETQHPRASNGEFSGSGSSSSRGKEHPFVATFLKEHKSPSAQKQYLATVPKEKLHTALRLLEGGETENSKSVRKRIEKELDERADRGA
ncbi:MAG: hypothetical protein ACLGPM_07630 [Acidobacteriota bacterium]